MAGVITEIAAECGVSEQAVRAWCRRNHVAKDAKGSSQSAKVKNPLYISIIWALNESKFRNLRKQVAKLAKPL